MRVIDLSHVMAGPTCGRMLADMGADVIKVERIDGGDDTRRLLPPDINGEAAAFMMMNRNKRGIVLDLKDEAGRAALLKLIAGADALIENYRHDTMARLGLGAERLREDFPGLIYCAISGFGRTGPWSTQGGYDLIAQGMSGLMAITGEGPGRPPVKVGAPVCDIVAGILGAMGIAAAYARKLKTGAGDVVDTSLLEAGITLTYWQSAIGLATGESPGPMGSAHPLNAPYQAFETADGWINIGAMNTRLWPRLCTLIGEPQLADDERFNTNGGRMANLDALSATLAPFIKARTTQDWLNRLEEVGIPSGPVLSIRDMHQHPQTLARAMVEAAEHPVAGRVETIGLPVKFASNTARPVGPAPVFGQHTREVLLEAGLTPAEIDDLIARRAAAGARVHPPQAVSPEAKD
ncbi:MAG: CoA transferase, partial [Pseudomonadota bacterium]